MQQAEIVELDVMSVPLSKLPSSVKDDCLLLGKTDQCLLKRSSSTGAFCDEVGSKADFVAFLQKLNQPVKKKRGRKKKDQQNNTQSNIQEGPHMGPSMGTRSKTKHIPIPGNSVNG